MAGSPCIIQMGIQNTLKFPGPCCKLWKKKKKKTFFSYQLPFPPDIPKPQTEQGSNDFETNKETSTWEFVF